MKNIIILIILVLSMYSCSQDNIKSQDTTPNFDSTNYNTWLAILKESSKNASLDNKDDFKIFIKKYYKKQKNMNQRINKELYLSSFKEKISKSKYADFYRENYGTLTNNISINNYFIKQILFYKKDRYIMNIQLRLFPGANNNKISDIMTGLGRLRDFHHILILIDTDLNIHNAIYICSAYDSLSIKSYDFNNDKINEILFILNESSLGGGYSLHQLYIYSILNKKFVELFKNPLKEDNHHNKIKTDLNFIINTNELFFTLQGISVKNKITNKINQSYHFNGSKFIKK